MSVNITGVDEILLKVSQYNEAYMQKVDEVIERCVDEGLEVVGEQFNRYDYPYETGELRGSFVGQVDHNEHSGLITNTARHAVFVEYGTGIKGNNNRHPKAPEVGYNYDTNNHGEDGWTYFDKFGILRWTAGMPARPFMYYAYLEMLRRVKRIIQEVFGG